MSTITCARRELTLACALFRRLKALLREKLVECGWRDQLKAHCKEVIKNKGLEKITVEDLVAEITPRGRATVPDAVKAELLQKIRDFLKLTS